MSNQTEIAPAGLKPKRKYNKQPNIITNCREDLSLMEKRIVYLVLNQMNIYTDEEYYTIRAADITRSTNKLTRALKRLRMRPYVIFDNDQKAHEVTPFPEFIYHKHKGLITIKVEKKWRRFYSSTTKGFTSFQLDSAMGLKSTYSMKLYEFLSRWKDRTSHRVSVQELQDIMSAGNKPYGEFKRSCLLRAQKEINERTELTFDFREEKAGKLVINIMLNIISTLLLPTLILPTYPLSLYLEIIPNQLI